MQLLIKRGQSKGSIFFWRMYFNLWAKFDLSAEERAVLSKYGTQRFILMEGNYVKARIWATIYATIITFTFMYIIDIALGFGSSPAVRLGMIVAIASWWVIYHHIRDEIKVEDILQGRYFKCRSVLSLLSKERTIQETAFLFRRFLEIMNTWNGVEIIVIERDSPPSVQMIEKPHEVV